MEPRIVVALAIITVVGIAAATALAIYLPRRRQHRLRRRGIKSYNRTPTR